MGLLKRYLRNNQDESTFSATRLVEALQEGLPTVSFAQLMGSASGCQDASVDRRSLPDMCIVKPYSDIDIAPYLHPGTPRGENLDVLLRAQSIGESVVPNVEFDCGILNEASVVYQRLA